MYICIPYTISIHALSNPYLVPKQPVWGLCWAHFCVSFNSWAANGAKRVNKKPISLVTFRSWPPRDPQNPPRPPQDPSKIDFWDDFGINLAAFGHPKRFKIFPRIYSRACQIYTRRDETR